MRITRREFLKYCTIAAGALGLTSSDLLKLKDLMANETGTKVMWLQGASCTGDSTSLLNTIFYTDPVGLLVTGDLSLEFHQTVMNASGTDLLGATDSMTDIVQALIPAATISTFAEWSSDTWSGGSESIKLKIADRSNESLEAGVKVTPSFQPLINEFDMTFRFKTGENQAPFVELDIVSQDTGTTTTLSSHYPGVSSEPWLTPADGGLFGPTDWKTVRLFDYYLWKAAAGPPDALPSIGTDPEPDFGAYTTWGGYIGTDALGDPTFVQGIKSKYGTARVTAVRIIDQGNTPVYTATASCTMYIDDISVAGVSYPDRDAALELYPSAGSGSEAYVLAIEGSVVTGKPAGGTHFGEFCEVGPMVPGNNGDETMLNAFLFYARNAVAVLAVGTCASYGGIPKLGVTGAKGCAQVLKDNGIKTPVINIPGCPAHPDWIVGTIAAFLARGLDGIDLDKQGRPRDFYGNYVCNGNIDVTCPWRYNNDQDDNGTADNLAFPIGESRGLAKYKWGSVALAGESYTDYDTSTTVDNYLQYHTFEGCLGVLGCRGRKTHADCAYRQWNAMTTLVPGSVGVNWCVGSRGGCQGCTEPDFPMLKRFYTFW